MSRSNHSATEASLPLSAPPVGLFRRLFAIFYDCFLLAALLFIVGAVLTSLNGGEAIEPGSWLNQVERASLLLVCFCYFGGFWTHGGQTLGMQTWKIKLVSNETGACVNWKQAAIRFLAAMLSWSLFGAGFLWALVDREKRGWHDLLSHSRLIDLR